MPLGLAKDSMINLAEMAQKKDEEEAQQEELDPSLQSGGSSSAALSSPSSSSDTKNIASSVAPAGEERVVKVETGEIQTKGEALDEVVEAAAEAGLTNAEVEALTGDQTGSSSSTHVIPDTEALNENSGPLELGMGSPASHTLPSIASNDSVSSGATGSSQNSRRSGEYPNDIEEEKKAEDYPPPPLQEAYAGFGPDYYPPPSSDDHPSYDYYHSSYDAYHDPSQYVTLLADQTRKEQRESFWCCIFPWIKTGSPYADTPHEESFEPLIKSKSNSFTRSSSREDDEVSTGSDAFGEKLSEKDRQAVLARLRLAQPDAQQEDGSDTSPSPQDQSGDSDPSSSQSPRRTSLLSELPPTQPAVKPIKGILKHPKASAARLSQIDLEKHAQQSGETSINGDSASTTKRRSLFPQYSPAVSKANSKNLSVAFAPMARLVTVKSKNDMTEQEKGSIWWQKTDYDEFRKTGRMITRAMLEGGSEIWLASNDSWVLPNQNRSATLKSAYHMSDQHRKKEVSRKDAEKEAYEATRDKWWHKFGHSRRGLEHIASIEEGRQRQANVRAAIRAIIEEQRKQKALRGTIDADKLRSVSIQNTLWARDLAIAAAHSDADAVNSEFDEESRKSREFYLLKFSRSKSSSSAASPTASSSKQSNNVPAFMQPMLTMQKPTSHLDAHTMSQIRYREKQQKAARKEQQLQIKEVQLQMGSPLKVEATTPIKDGDARRSSNGSTQPQQQQTPGHRRDNSSSMAKRAAGFSTGQEAAPNMAAILSGMGADTPKEVGAVGGP